MRDPVVTITARTGAEPELSYLNDGTALCKVRAAYSDDRPDGDGGFVAAHTTWLGVEWWGDAADMVYSMKIGTGDLIRVTGHLWMDEFTRKDGSFGTALKLRADGTPKLWRKRERSASAAAPSAPAAAPAPGPSAGSAQGAIGGNDDPPF